MPNDEGGSGGDAAPQPLPTTFATVADAEEFRLTAIRIFGLVGWKKKTAMAFGVMESTVYRWVSESVDLPHYAASAMAAWLIVYEITGKTPPLAPDENETPKPAKRGPPRKRRLAL